MGMAKIEFTVGGISFSGEGEDKWLADQLDKIIEKAPELVKIAPVKKGAIEENADSSQQDKGKSDDSIGIQTLPNFLKSKNVEKNQIQKYLATAIWLHAKGSNRISTSNVTKALKDSNQSRLGNPSECLAQNVKRGFIEKDGNQFYVTEEGKASLK